MLGALQAEPGVAPVVVLEATGYYHRALMSCLNRSDYTYYIVNPLQSKGTQLRKGKQMLQMLGIWQRCTIAAT